MKCRTCGEEGVAIEKIPGALWIIKCTNFRCRIRTDIYMPELTEGEILSLYRSNDFAEELIIKS